MRVTSPVGWLALLAVAVMIAAVGVWSVVGSIPDLVDGQGTLFRGERLYDIKATMSGTSTRRREGSSSCDRPDQT